MSFAKDQYSDQQNCETLERDKGAKEQRDKGRLPSAGHALTSGKNNCHLEKSLLFRDESPLCLFARSTSAFAPGHPKEERGSSCKNYFHVT